jgi:tetratricopeptide (TPR) repeat protein
MKVRAIIARGETFAEQGHFLEAVEQYQKALDQEPNNGLALFRMGESFFYQKNYAAAANSFRGAIGGINDLNSKWVEVWSHIYMGKIFDLTGQRDRAVNEYNQALHMKDDTGGAQEEAQKYLTAAYKEGM